MASISIFAKTDVEYNPKAVFDVRLSESIYDQTALRIEADSTDVTFFLSRAQINQLFGALNTYIEANPCDKCANTGTLPVFDGVSSYSGDDACECQPLARV